MLLELSIKELATGLKAKKFSSEDIVKECYLNIERFNKQINAFITILDKNAVLEIAREKDNSRSGESSILHGLPFIIKDSYNTQDVPTTAASTVLKNYLPPYNSTVYQKLLDSGA